MDAKTNSRCFSDFTKTYPSRTIQKILHFFKCSPKPTLYISKLVQACIKEPCHCFPWTCVYIYTHFSLPGYPWELVCFGCLWGLIGFQCILTRFPVSCLKSVFHPLHPKLAGLHPECPQSINNGSLEFKLPTIWTHEKQRWEEPEKRREEERRSRADSSVIRSQLRQWPVWSLWPLSNWPG